ncbi:zona pellucida sperm-binding protein 2-like [Chanos chanos]|uniref:Zona pellucida sperm-binding protein 2-like n=1 Tax=Chanos chanos TaxID=29144 RepID=A0A6J2VWV6_CHACN|nr:zona pellucida sperm-binding protein 2-like [Chanos chanos]
MVFFTPKEKAMLLDDALKAGYGISATATRLVLRSPYNTPETYTENVHGVPMEVFRATTYFKGSWSVAMLDTAAACPTGGLVFTDELIRWYMPQHITPLSLNVPEILEVYMGIDGKRLDAEGMASKGYVLSMQDSQILMEIPIGGPDGYYKSHALDYQYHITYTIEPMLEMLWREGDLDLTRYKVLFPITTPPMPRPPHVIDQTVPELRMFDVLLGTFLFDVELANITFSTGVLTVAEANAQGISVQENRLSNGSKTFTLQVPFSDPVVLKHNPSPEVTTYTLPLLYGLMVLPEQTPFPHPALVEATVQDIVLPTVTGICDQERFYVTVEYGNRGSNFKTYVGQRELSPEVAEEYGFYENSTHMTLAVSYLASDVVFELVQPSSVRGRLDLYLFDPNNNWILRDFSLACPFPMTMTECLSNGTMTALAVKVESVPQLVPSQLTLKDPSCRPTFSNDRFAYFTFDLTSCGTTRAFFDGVVMYQNEISDGSGHAVKRPGAQKGVSRTSPLEPEYRLTVSCYYLLNDTKTIAFVPRPMSNEPIADVGFGELQVWMRLAKDMSYDVFYTEQEFPVVQHLRRPLYFEVELRQSIDPRMEIVLENCWATLHEDRASTPRWDLIVDGCENSADQYLTALVSVTPDTRVQYPTHYKRFEVKMFTFVRDERVLTDQIFVHCDAVLCDSGKETAGVCSKRCASQPGRNSIKAQGGHKHMIPEQ